VRIHTPAPANPKLCFKQVLFHGSEKMLRLLVTATLLLAAALTGAHDASARDVKGSSDHPLVPRYEGSEILRHGVQAFTDYRLYTQPVRNSGGPAKNVDATILLEGKLTRITYRAPAERSSLEVFRNYEGALRKAGFQTIFACSARECGGRNFNHAVSPREGYSWFGEYHAEQRFLSARLPRPEGDVYVSLYVVMNKAGGGPNKDRAILQLDVVEVKPMEERMVVAKAGDMQRGIGVEGRVAVYGILFDFDKDTLRPDSRPQLEEIASLMKGAPKLRVLIVGHTDAAGAMDYNQKLSERRARAVVEALVRDHGVERARLASAGVGMAAPVATNRTDEGRAKNRRVELVERGN
jgi:outer membrane protein OmpA-like peptidoglycan-associated protein